MAPIWEVFFRGKELEDPSPRSVGKVPASTSAEVEAFEEQRINAQVFGVAEPPPPSRATLAAGDLQSLPRGGRFDDLLRPGRAADLLQALPSIFRSDPPVNCGAHSETVGLSCAFGERYSSDVFSPFAVAQHLRLSSSFWKPGPENNVSSISVPAGGRIMVVGDVHGQLEDVLWVFFKYGFPTSKNQYLFNGDIVDRGGHSIEIILLLLALKRDDPSCVHVLRGNHEDMQCGIHFGFRAELQHKFGVLDGLTLWNQCCTAVFPLLPIVGIVNGILTGGRRFCVLHGGVPVDCPGQKRPISIAEDLGRLNRGVVTMQATAPTDFESNVLFNLLWADPCESGDAKRVGNHGRGNRFVERDTVAFCEHNSVAFVVRSHEVPRSLRGAVAMHGGKCFTVFSASNYMGSTGNRGGVFVGDVGKGLTLKEHSAPAWPKLAEVFSVHKLTAPTVDTWEEAERIEKECVLLANGARGAVAGSPRSAAGTAANAEAQLQQFMMERICDTKDELFARFKKLDRGMSGFVTRAQWSQVLFQQLGPECPDLLTPAVMETLAGLWRIQDPVGYVRFLHRFQIRGPDDDGSAPDLMREASRLRKSLLDSPSQSFERLLDPDGDNAVSMREFLAFLPQFGIDVTFAQAGSLYEAMCSFVKQSPLSVDNAVLCLAIMSRDPPPVNRWSTVAENIGSEIIRAGKSYAFAFRFWDNDRDGFLSLEELQQGLRQLSATSHIDAASIESFMCYIDSMGQANRRISMFEFVRAVAPRKLVMELHEIMLKEILKRVWTCRSLLSSLLVQCDPRSNRVSTEDFKGCLMRLNLELENRGRPLLSDVQVASICDIASRGTRFVQYERFLQGLHVVDVGAAG